jgi:N-acetylmuramoyl-L-alanine amidase
VQPVSADTRVVARALLTVPTGLNALFLGLLVAILVNPAEAQAQAQAQTLEGRADGLSALTLALPEPVGSRAIPVQMMGGTPYVLAPSLSVMGWDAIPGPDGASLALRHRTGITLHFIHGSPWMRWEDDLMHMSAPALLAGDPHLPVQLLVDFLPGMLPAAYAWDPETRVLVVEGAAPPPGTAARPTVRGVAATAPPSPTAAPSSPAAIPASAVIPAGQPAAAPAPPASTPRSGRAPRVVIIDAGHGGSDPGAVGPGGEREKDIALAVSLAVARELSERPDLEVRLTRDRDELVDLWTRGDLATGWKEERPGVFLSIHLNSVPDRPGVRGFETYFLSEARTDHERRVAAAENAPLFRGQGDAGVPDASAADPLLSLILRDLVAFDHTHWSALLAEKVQRELATFHPGPDRGVKQGPFAVLTNTLMPSVLVELGFVSNREEARAMAQPAFQREAAKAIARAVDAFFTRYPPGGTP